MGHRREDSKAGRLRAALLALLREHQRDGMLPTSARFLFYELEMRGVVSKERTGARRPDQDVSDALTTLREDGDVPWAWVKDETRQVTTWRVAPSVAAYVRDAVERASIDPWGDEVRPVVLTESRSLAGVLAGVAAQYAVPIASTNGQTAGFLHNDLGPALAAMGNAAGVLYLGDLDLSGGHIEDNDRRVLERILGRALEWRRLAVTPEQVRQHGLTVIQKKDGRHGRTGADGRREGRAFDAVETEALSQRVIVGLLTDALDDLLPEPLEAVRAREREQRDRVRRALSGLS